MTVDHPHRPDERLMSADRRPLVTCRTKPVNTASGRWLARASSDRLPGKQASRGVEGRLSGYDDGGAGLCCCCRCCRPSKSFLKVKEQAGAQPDGSQTRKSRPLPSPASDVGVQNAQKLAGGGGGAEGGAGRPAFLFAKKGQLRGGEGERLRLLACCPAGGGCARRSPKYGRPWRVPADGGARPCEAADSFAANDAPAAQARVR
jgi:hypothetical protein